MFKKIFFTLWFSLLSSGCAHSKAHAVSDLDTDIDRLKVNVRLAQMIAEDQAVRFGWMWFQKKGHKLEDVFQNPKFQSEFGQMDKKNTEELKQILKTWGWVKISEFGETPSQNAWLLVQHADHDVVFQEEVLNLLEGALKTNDVTPQNYAYLWDRVRVNKKELQRYGSQGMCVGKGKWEPKAIEEPVKKLDERRKSMGLEPMSEYLKQVSQMCL
jgi:hypothetical protein